MSLLHKIKRALRGDVRPQTVVLESLRRGQASFQRGRDRVRLERQNSQPARLRSEFATLHPDALVEHFRQRSQPTFFAGFDLPTSDIGAAQRRLFPKETDDLLADAERITRAHCWPLLGLGDKCFGSPIEWHRDPLSDFVWPLDYYGDINLMRGDGSDVRFVWELNRFGHFITIARAYSVSGDQRFSTEFFTQVEGWHSSNPLGRGVNWNCAMEVALRAMNLLGAFAVFRRAPEFDADKLARLLAIFDEHGKFIREHLEFSYIATSNHYLSDVVGLLWLGLMLPELENAEAWRAFGLRELLREMDQQVLDDGADFESSTGYHRFVLELFVYSFVLCRANGIEIEERYWNKLHKMFQYLRAYLRPDGYAPLIGDSDSGQVFPICHRRADDHEYLLAIGTVLFEDPKLKTSNAIAPPELLWLLAEQMFAKFGELESDSAGEDSHGFPDAGIYVMRERDLYLLFNASGAGIGGRGSHGHNDALSIEVSACGRPFIVDPGTYVYTANLQERHLFRSTAYHSTVEIDGVEQNTTNEQMPFVIGNEALAGLLRWETGGDVERVSAEHDGYKRLPQPATHRRTVTFHKRNRYWLIEDEFEGTGSHQFATRFHFDSGLDVEPCDGLSTRGVDKASGHLIVICPLDLKQLPELQPQFTSRDYGQKTESLSACWTVLASVPLKLRWAIIPVHSSESEAERLRSVLS